MRRFSLFKPTPASLDAQQEYDPWCGGSRGCLDCLVPKIKPQTVLMAPNSHENRSTVTSHDFSYMVKLLFLKGFRWAFRGLRGRRKEGCEHTRLLLQPLASAVVLVWSWPISWKRFNERRIGAEARLLLCFNEPSVRLWTSDRHGALWTPNDTSSPRGDGAAEAIVFAPCGEISKQHLFVTPGSPLGPAFVISLEGGKKPTFVL